MLIQNMASVVIFELHRTCSRSLSGCIGHGFLLVTFDDQAVISKILCNLPSSFDGLLPAWRMQPAGSKTLDNLTLQLLSIKSTMKSRSDSNVATASTYVTSGKSKKIGEPSEYTVEQRAARKKFIKDRKKQTKYWKCGEIGHRGRECEAPEEQQKKYQESQKKPESSSETKHVSFKAFMATINYPEDDSAF
jgi:hypothetical protein